MAVEVVLPCDRCSPVARMALDQRQARLKCLDCGSERAFTRRPVYLITGPPGAGKTGVALRLSGKIDQLPVFDTDLFGAVAHPEWASWATAWLLVAHGLANSGFSTVLCGYGLHRSEIDALPARQLVGDLHALNIDLAKDELRSRLQRRPNYDTARIDRKVTFAGRLREEADANISATDMSVDDVAAEVEYWLRDRMKAQADVPG